VLPTYVSKNSVAYLYGQNCVAYLYGQKLIKKRNPSREVNLRKLHLYFLC